MDSRNSLPDHLPLSLSLHAFPRGFSVLFILCTAFAISYRLFPRGNLEKLREEFSCHFGPIACGPGTDGVASTMAT